MKKKLAFVLMMGLATAAFATEVAPPPREVVRENKWIFGETCGYSLGGEDTAWSDAENNANQDCIAQGCKGALYPWSWWDSWQANDGTYYACFDYVCDCS